jgi:transcription elongation GreA/GreB family factor
LAGSLVQTSRGNYFLSVGLGKISVEGQDFWAISPTSPIGELMYKKTVGHQFSFNGTKFAIEHIL